MQTLKTQFLPLEQEISHLHSETRGQVITGSEAREQDPAGVLGCASVFSINVAATWVKGTGDWGQTGLRMVGQTPQPWHSTALGG